MEGSTEGLASSRVSLSESSEGAENEDVKDDDCVGIRVIGVTQKCEEEAADECLDTDLILKEWLEWAIQKQREGVVFTDSIRSNLRLQNPSLMENMIVHCKIDQYGSNLKPKFSHNSYLHSQYYTEIANTVKSNSNHPNANTPNSRTQIPSLQKPTGLESQK